MVRVNDVYQTVLTILNKEQRGYLTPYEFNNIATQVQLEIFEEYTSIITEEYRVNFFLTLKAVQGLRCPEKRKG